MTVQDDVAAILALEQSRARAIVEADVETLDRLTDEAYYHVESSGRVNTKAGFLAHLQDGPGRFERYDLYENAVNLHRDVAVVTGLFENVYRTNVGDCMSKRARHIRVYVRRDGHWRNTVHQATALPPETPNR